MKRIVTLLILSLLLSTLLSSQEFVDTTIIVNQRKIKTRKSLPNVQIFTFENNDVKIFFSKEEVRSTLLKNKCLPKSKLDYKDEINIILDILDSDSKDTIAVHDTNRFLGIETEYESYLHSSSTLGSIVWLCLPILLEKCNFLICDKRINDTIFEKFIFVKRVRVKLPLGGGQEGIQYELADGTYIAEDPLFIIEEFKIDTIVDLYKLENEPWDIKFDEN